MSPRPALDRPRLVLASGSPRRRELLASVGVVADVIVTDIDETPHADEAAQDLVARLAQGKAEAAVLRCDADAQGNSGARRGHALFIGSDTVVEIAGAVLGKPVDDEDARSMLRRLSNQTHRVHTGVCVVSATPGQASEVGLAVSITTVTMRSLSKGDIDWYLATGDHRGKAGSYAIQGYAAPFVVGIDGPYDGVVGLPLHRLDQILTEFGWPLRLFSSAEYGQVTDG